MSPISAGSTSSAAAAPGSSSCATPARSTPRTTGPCTPPRWASTWSCSIPRSRSACCAAACSSTPLRRPADLRAGINLTRLYHGKIPYLFFLVRDLGLVNKIYRGLSTAEHHPDEPEDTIEKLWVAAVDTYAIGGGCQLLHVVDHVIAERGARLYLPARKEGIIPGASPLRLPRAVGDRYARQAILSGLEFEAGVPPAQLLVDEVVETEEMDAAVEARVAALTSSGLVNAAANRRAIRIAQEPIDLFRRYMATYAREQAVCHLSPALVRNLEEHWNAAQRASEQAIWDPVETLDREQLRALQLERLRATAARLGLEEIGSLDELGGLPFSTKADLRDAYPFGLLAVPREELVRVHASSGTHGKPTVVGYTRADLDAWTELMARCMTWPGCGRGWSSTTQHVRPVTRRPRLPPGRGAHRRGRHPGCRGLHRAPGDAALRPRRRGAHLDALLRAGHRPGGPRRGHRPGEPAPRGRLFGGEPWTEAMRAEIERRLGLAAVNFYGLSELCGPGVAAECLHVRDGLHVQEDHFLVEVIDPETGDHSARARRASSSSRPWRRRPCPCCRYRTGDIGAVTEEPCACGRTMARIAALRGRRDDMLIIRGVNLFPSHVEHLLVGLEEVAPHYQLVVDRSGTMHELSVRCEPADGEVDRAALAERLEHLLREHTGIRIAVEVLEPGGVPRSEGKAVRVVERD